MIISLRRRPVRLKQLVGHHTTISSVCKHGTESIEKKCGDILTTRISRIQTRKVV